MTPKTKAFLDRPEVRARIERIKARIAAEKRAATPEGKAETAWRSPVTVASTESLPTRVVVRRANEAMKAVERKLEQDLRDSAETSAERNQRIRREMRAAQEAEIVAQTAPQAALDQHWRNVVAHRQRLEALAERGCHRLPGDPDYRGGGEMSGDYNPFSRERMGR